MHAWVCSLNLLFFLLSLEALALIFFTYSHIDSVRLHIKVQHEWAISPSASSYGMLGSCLGFACFHAFSALHHS